MTIFRSMTPDRDSNTHPENHARKTAALMGDYPRGETTRCEKCGGLIYSGDWPWCGKGGKADHERY